MKAEAAIDRLAAHLKEPVQDKPIAWARNSAGGIHVCHVQDEPPHDAPWTGSNEPWIPLYSSPQDGAQYRAGYEAGYHSGRVDEAAENGVPPDERKALAEGAHGIVAPQPKGRKGMTHADDASEHAGDDLVRCSRCGAEGLYWLRVTNASGTQEQSLLFDSCNKRRHVCTPADERALKEVKC